MNKLFLIDGAAGTGKSDLMEFVKRQSDYDIYSVGKITTREPRNIEEAKTTDLIFVSSDEFETRKRIGDYYIYKYGSKGEEYDYALSKEELIASITRHEFTFAIVRSRPTITQITKELSSYALIKHVFIYTDKNEAKERMRKDGFDEEQITFRTRRNQILWDEEKYYDSNRVTIINNSNPEDFHAQIRNMMDSFSSKQENEDILYINGTTNYRLMASLVGKKGDIVRQLRQYPFEKNIFLMMKYRVENESIYGEIKRIIEEYGYNCVRADAPDWTLLSGDVDNYLAALYCCKYGIALFDRPEKGADFSPNVAYELGIMYCQRKKCLILKHKSLNQIPFDLIQKLFKEYDDGTQIRNHLEKWLKSIKREEK